jgi:glycosyltransferase involved in cell wall biosynthesis
MTLLQGETDVDADAADRFDKQYATRVLAPLVVVIAAYNEQDGVGAVVRSIPRQVCGLATDTIVVVDGSTDQTAAAAADAGAFVCHVSVNRGQGAALRLGYRLAADHGAAYIATLDADGQYDAAELARVVGPLLDDEADFVSGSRRLGQAHTTDRVRGLGVIVFGALITVLTGQRVTDPANGLRAMKVEVTDAVRLEQPQYQAAELLVGAALRGFRVAEVPTTMFERSAGSTKKGGNLAYGLRFARVIGRTWWRDRSSKDH